MERQRDKYLALVTYFKVLKIKLNHQNKLFDSLIALPSVRDWLTDPIQELLLLSEQPHLQIIWEMDSFSESIEWPFIRSSAEEKNGAKRERDRQTVFRAFIQMVHSELLHSYRQITLLSSLVISTPMTLCLWPHNNKTRNSLFCLWFRNFFSFSAVESDLWRLNECIGIKWTALPATESSSCPTTRTAQKQEVPPFDFRKIILILKNKLRRISAFNKLYETRNKNWKVRITWLSPPFLLQIL